MEEKKIVINSDYWAKKTVELILKQKEYQQGTDEYKKIDEEILAAKDNMELCIKEEDKEKEEGRVK